MMCDYNYILDVGISQLRYIVKIAVRCGRAICFKNIMRVCVCARFYKKMLSLVNKTFVEHNFCVKFLEKAKVDYIQS